MDDPLVSYTDFINRLHQSANEAIDKNLGSFEISLTKALQKRDPNISKESINEACLLFGKLLRNKCDINLDKFDIYTQRNILIKRPSSINGSTATATATSSSTSSSSSDTIHPYTSTIQKVLESDIERINTLRMQYENLKKTHLELQQQQLNAEQLLNECRKALFQYRLEYQVFDSQPLSELIISIQDKINQVNILQTRAEKLKDQLAMNTTIITSTSSSSSSSSSSIAAAGAAAVITDNHTSGIVLRPRPTHVQIGSQDTSKLTASLRR